MTEFNAETVIAVGGWDPRFARVVDVQVDGDVAAALVDANGDGADLNVDIYMRDSGGRWTEVASGNGSVSSHGVVATWTEEDRLILTRANASAD